MQVTYLKGNVVDVDCDIILHQVNCKGVMGSGVAKAVKDKYPEVFVEYLNKVMDRFGPSSELLGEVLIVKTFEGKKVANLFSQDSYGYGKQHTNYDAMREGLTKLNEMCVGETIALPYRMGSDRGGGSWEIVLNIVKETLKDCKIIVVEYGI